MLNHDQIQEHIDELDAQIPKEDAELLIWYEGDSSGCEIIDNYLGYLRFGIEMLKAAVVELEAGVAGTNISINYMEVTRWCLHVKRITRREDVRSFLPPLLQRPAFTWKDYVKEGCEVLLGIFVCLCLLIGFGEVLIWIWHLPF
jgi:hypothetical protein